jgi:hypothetical protein
MKAIRWVTLASAAGIVLLVTGIVLSMRQMPLSAGLRDIARTLWGVTTLADLYLGLFAVAGWIAFRERSLPRSLAWLAALCLLGNLATLVYIFMASLREPTIARLLRPDR